jgi:hypothetical protein
VGSGTPVLYIGRTVLKVKFLIIRPTRCTKFLNLFLEWNFTCFGQFLCPSSGVFHRTYRNGIPVCHTGLLTACSQAVSKPVWNIPVLYVRWKTPDDGQRNCPKHVKFHSKNKFEKLVHLVGLIIRIVRLVIYGFCKYVISSWICIARVLKMWIAFQILLGWIAMFLCN